MEERRYTLVQLNLLNTAKDKNIDVYNIVTAYFLIRVATNEMVINGSISPEDYLSICLDHLNKLDIYQNQLANCYLKYNEVENLIKNVCEPEWINSQLESFKQKIDQTNNEEVQPTNITLAPASMLFQQNNSMIAEMPQSDITATKRPGVY